MSDFIPQFAYKTILIMACMFFGCQELIAEQDVESKAADSSWKAIELAELFDKNGPGSESRFKNQILSISGEINDITSFLTDLYVTLDGGFLAPDIDCYFSSKQKDVVYGLSKGSVVQLKGKFKEFSLGNIKMSGCIVESGYASGTSHTARVVPTSDSSEVSRIIDSHWNATELSHLFKNDSSAAAKRFAGKTLSVNGEIALTSTFLGDSNVTLNGGYESPDISCFFPKDRKDAVTALSEGDSIRLRGKFARYSSFAGRVVLEDCAIEAE